MECGEGGDGELSTAFLRTRCAGWINQGTGFTYWSLGVEGHVEGGWHDVNV